MRLSPLRVGRACGGPRQLPSDQHLTELERVLPVEFN
jgi:hypothetical protein